MGLGEGLTNKLVKVGCCGFRRSMREYFGQFRLVEVQRTFYKMPGLETVERWRADAPDDFEFTLKAWQLITHPPTSPTYRKAGIEIAASSEGRYGFFRPTDEVMAAWEETQKVARALQARTIVFQCPASFTQIGENIENMRRFFRSARDSGFIFAWEPRGDWEEKVIRDLCRELGLVHCVDPMEKEPVSEGLRYFRLHGGPGYRHKYTAEELDRLKEKVTGRECYVLFNNLNMYDDALSFKRLLENDEP